MRPYFWGCWCWKTSNLSFLSFSHLLSVSLWMSMQLSTFLLYPGNCCSLSHHGGGSLTQLTSRIAPFFSPIKFSWEFFLVITKDPTLVMNRLNRLLSCLFNALFCVLCLVLAPLCSILLHLVLHHFVLWLIGPCWSRQVHSLWVLRGMLVMKSYINKLTLTWDRTLSANKWHSLTTRVE